jgi:hypothetical protein
VHPVKAEPDQDVLEPTGLVGRVEERLGLHRDARLAKQIDGMDRSLGGEAA